MNTDFLKNLSKKARKCLTPPNINDKVICFIPSWEQYSLSIMPIDRDEDVYHFLANEQRVFNKIRSHYLKDGEFKYAVYQKFDEDYTSEEDKEELRSKFNKTKSGKKILDEIDRNEKAIKRFEKGLFKNKKDKNYYKLRTEINQMTEADIGVMPYNPLYEPLINQGDFAVLKKVNMLCIDYKYFNYSIVKEYIKYHEAIIYKKNINVSPRLKPLHKLFEEVSINIFLDAYTKIAQIIDSIYNGKFNTENQDELEFLGKNHLQNIQKPIFWESIKETEGYLCNNNKNENYKSVTKKETKKDDFRFFYSFQSLLFFELKQMIFKIKRCKNCNYPLPEKYTGSYCSEKLKSYKKCYQERLRKRQKKHYNLTKS